MKIKIVKQILFFLLIVFYLFAGYNHFATPSFYIPIIPPYLADWAKEINILSGIAEIVLALLLIPKATRSLAVKGVIIMLIAFIPSHIYFIQKGDARLIYHYTIIILRTFICRTTHFNFVGLVVK